jgi:amino acid adenylation domain-containing protein
VQDVIERVEIPVERSDWRALAEAERQQRFQALLDQDRARGFDLGQAPLMRLAFVRIAEREHWVLWTFHHALLDGRAYSLVLREVFAFYEAFSRGADADLPLPRPYRDYIEWRRKLDDDSTRPYWRSVLSGFQAPTPLVVTLDREPEHVTGRIWGAHEIRLSAALTNALKERAHEASVTLNTLLQGAWALLLHRYSGAPDIVFGATRACRRSAGADDMVGLFINTLPIRVSIDPEARLVPWLQQLRAQQVAMRKYEHTPLVVVQGWSDVPRGTPLFESILVFENQTLDAQLRALGEAWSERRFVNFGQAGFPLALVAWGGDELVLQLDYSRRRFAAAVVARMVGHLQTLLEGMAAHPQAILRDLSLLTAAERHQLLVEWNDTDTDDPADALLHKLFEAQAARTPDAVAVASDGRTLSYGGLDRRANQLAHALRKRGVGPDVLVGLCVNRTADMIVALLGIFKAGGAYVPLDPEYPAKRLAFMIEDCGTKVLITEQSLQASLAPLPAGLEAIYLDRDAEALAAEREDAPRSEVELSNLAYAIYTSGSTGQPKAALLTHRGLLNLAVSEMHLYGIRPQSRVLQFSSLSFDASLSEIAMALCSGAALYVEGRDTILPGPDLERYLEREKITVLSLTPSALAMLDPSAARSVEQLIVGGEPCSAELAARWAGQCRFFNAYGPTETTITATYVEYCNGALPPLIGRPLPNVRVYILDRSLQPVPVGVPGEIYIGGIGVARGYLGRPMLNAESFRQDPFRGASGALMYRTGDFGRWRSDGQIDFIGRLDDQVNIRGFRIELGEIEAVLAENPNVRQAAVHLWTAKEGDVRIVACCVPAGAGLLAPISLRKHLRARLPQYMIPQHFLLVDKIPLTPNGKVDRRRLPTPVLTESRIGRHEAPSDPVEATIAEIWVNLINPSQPIGRADKFFEMGGHSLLALEAMGQMEQKLGVKLDLQMLLQESLADIAMRCRPERIA